MDSLLTNYSNFNTKTWLRRIISTIYFHVRIKELLALLTLKPLDSPFYIIGPNGKANRLIITITSYQLKKLTFLADSLPTNPFVLQYQAMNLTEHNFHLLSRQIKALLALNTFIPLDSPFSFTDPNGKATGTYHMKFASACGTTS